MSANTEVPEKEYCSTTEAAQRLGLSLGTVQQMVENGLLEGWKTAGGHRRIRVSSIEDFRARAAAGGGQTVSRPPGVLQVLVAEDDGILQKLYEHTFSSWGLAVQVRMVASGIDGLLEIGRMPPDLLITDLRMPGIDGFEMIRRLRADPQLADLDIVVVSGLTDEEIAENGGLPADVTLYGKPVPFRELKGYVQAKIMAMQRNRKTA
ncbi:MAG TPA: response regulator [Zoogloea sp.]|uniref:response regulator n=1 Tax=Zoogloea sp. TaxID=49181 RepID=UPI002BBBB6CF|nr:response regulator [Zoogloea sp.]HMV18355.1 response regulator [Rhodocyclaceae bacterium]HMW51559.1 response regulator [Rhodocyclaceae bacterium]HMY49376.1 response regulator [Rhodocyclaceae bacterium]HMZ77416.1 response regulator [Rhodocyclaceae bacterium]HNA67948.1 response regulator [Rhodocyclaceae bacterium]